jgi:transposase-like protein
VDSSAKRRRSWRDEAKQRIAEESFEGSASVAELSQKYAVNANQIFQWRKQYREGRLENSSTSSLVPVTVTKEIVVQVKESRDALLSGREDLQLPLLDQVPGTNHPCGSVSRALWYLPRRFLISTTRHYK